jgi:hypothetical protein
MPEKNKGAKKKTKRLKGVGSVAGTKTRKAVTRQARTRARELCELG